jgi:hypothetical protein
MATIYTRATKGSALTWTEGDANITNLNTDITNIVNGNTAVGNAGAVSVVTDETSNNSYLTFVNGTTGNQSVKINTNVTFNPQSNVLSASTVNATIGSLSDRFNINGSIVRVGSQLDITAGSGGGTTNIIGGTHSGSISYVLPSAQGGTGHVLTNNGSGVLSWNTVSGGIELTNLSVTDTGGDGSLSYNNTTGVFTYTGPSAAEVRAHFSAGTNITIVDGVISSTASGGGGDLVDDLTPQLGGNLDVNGKNIVSVSNGNIVLVPDGTGDVFLSCDRVRVGEDTGDVDIAGVGGSNANIKITPDGTGKTVVKNLTHIEAVYSLGNISGTITPNAANGNVQTATLTGNITLNGFASPVEGQSITLILTQDSTGNRLLTSNMRFANLGYKTLSTAATATDIISITFVGGIYWASLGRGYQ